MYFVRGCAVYHALRVCSNRGGYEAVPHPPLTLNLRDVRHRLEQAGIAVVDARVMLIAALEAEVTIGQSGRLLFKTQDAAVAARSFDRLRTLLHLPSEGDAPAGFRS